MANTDITTCLKPTLFICLLFSLPVAASTTLDLYNIAYKGHIKYQTVITDIQQDSVFHNISADPAIDNHFNLRLNLQLQQPSWVLNVDYQILARAGDRVLLTRVSNGACSKICYPTIKGDC